MLCPHPTPYVSEEPQIPGRCLISGPGLTLCDAPFAYSPRNPEKTVLYRIVAEQLETFLERQRRRGRPVPRFVERELRSYLDCGILARGFLRVHCDACGKDRLVAYSCKGRGFCASCCGRRMADTAAHLVDRVFPEAPVNISLQIICASWRRRAGSRAGGRTIRASPRSSCALWRVQEPERP